jgi:hypothetical protein
LSARPAYEFHLHQWSDIQAHLPRLFKAAKGNCLEIGVRFGISTSALLAGIEEHGGHLTSVDINECKIFEGHPQWTFVKADTQNFTEDLKHYLRDFDLLFVDGDHTYEGALSDLQAFGPHAKRIFVHDTSAPDYPGVRRAVDTFCAQMNRKVKYHEGSYGMAEIQ